VSGQGRALDDDAEALESLRGHLWGDEVVDPRGRLGSGTGAEDERIGAVVGGLGDHLQGALEVAIGLAGETDDDVGGDGQVGDGGPGGGQAIEVALGGIATVHCGEHPVAAGL
jgi:hypothetical protein